MTRTVGRCRKGVRLKAKVPHGHWKTMTFIGALRLEGVTAPLVLDAPVNGESFLAWVEQSLVPTLMPGDVVVMDRLGSHRLKAVRTAIRRCGAKLFLLPGYSPDLNPIEQIFSKIKALMRKAAERTVEAVWKRLGTLLDTITRQECANCFKNSGYASI